MKKIALVFLALVFITSCHIEKRRYLPGYSVSWSLGFGQHSHGRNQSNYPEKSNRAVADSAVSVVQATPDSTEHASEFSIENQDTRVIHENRIEKEPLGNEKRLVERKKKSILDREEQRSFISKDSPIAQDMNSEILREKNFLGTHGNSDLETLLLVILAVIAPPLAVLIETGISKAFWIDLILALIGGSFLFGVGLPLIQGLAALSAIILALLVVFHHNPISSVTSELKPKGRPQGIPWTAFIFPPFALRWLDGVKSGEIVLACFLTIFLNYIGYIYVMRLISKYPLKQFTEEQLRVMKLNRLAVFFSIVGVLATFIYVSVYTDLFN
jgi:uncharacterized membrane protein YqaE (UPF0057 family)